MPTIKLSTQLKDEKGNTLGTSLDCLVVDKDNNFIKDNSGQLVVATINKPDIGKTIKEVICSSLLHETPNKPLTGVEKSKRYRLWLLVNESIETVEIPTEDVLIIKNCILETQPILIAGQCEALIEGK